MPRLQTYNCTLEGESRQEKGSWRCLYPNVDTKWNDGLFSTLVDAISALMVSLSVAFSPFTFTTFVTCKYFDPKSQSQSSLTRLVSSDRGISLSPAKCKNTTDPKDRKRSIAQNEQTLVEYDHDLFAPSKNDDNKTHNMVSSITNTNLIARDPRLSPRPGINFKGPTAMSQISRSPMRKRGVSIITDSETCDDEDDNHFDLGNSEEPVPEHEEPQPSKKPKFCLDESRSQQISSSVTTTTATDRSLGKRKSPTNNISEEEVCDDEKKESNCSSSNTGQRKQRRKKKPKRTKVKQLRSYDANWETMFKALREYKKKHGNASVPLNARYPELRKWVSNQQAANSTSKLSFHRYQKLDSIGFTWEHQRKTPWMRVYRRLVAYKEEHNGSTAVPREYPKDRKLGIWANRQRMLFRTNRLSTVHFDLLNSIDFSWGTRSEKETLSHWIEMYRQLLSYKEKHSGSININCNHKKNKNKKDLHQLANWVKEQRIMIRADKLPKNQAELLRSVGVRRKTLAER